MFTKDNALPSANNNNRGNQPSADAFINLHLIDNNGVEHKLGGLPLYMQKKMHQCAIEAHNNNEDIVFQIVGRIKLVVDEEDKPEVHF